MTSAARAGDAMRTNPAWENLVLILAALVIWPKFILGWPAPIWTWLAYGTLGVLVLILLRRVKRFRSALDEEAKGPKRDT